MPFETGIPRYVRCKAEIYMHFPVDDRGREYIQCDMCDYFGRNSGRCNITHEVIAFPSRYIGGECPLEQIQDEKEDENAKHL